MSLKLTFRSLFIFFILKNRITVRPVSRRDYSRLYVACFIFISHYLHITMFSNIILYRWYINEKTVIGDYTTEMIIPNATRELHDAIVKCEVHNEVGKSEETETLDITCKYHIYFTVKITITFNLCITLHQIESENAINIE